MYKPRDTEDCCKASEAKRGMELNFPENPGGNQPWRQLDSALPAQNGQGRQECCFKPSGLWELIQAAGGDPEVTWWLPQASWSGRVQMRSGDIRSCDSAVLPESDTLDFWLGAGIGMCLLP